MSEEIKTESYVNTTYFQRIRDMVDDIYRRTSGTMPLSVGFVSINKNDLYRKCALALLQEGIVENHGTRMEPLYIWKTAIKLQESIYHRVYMRVREINRRYYKPKAKEVTVMLASTPEENVVPASETPVEKESPVLMDGVSDQELWDELKKRGFVIVDNTLSKTIVLK
jgi:hypothetical protein